MDVDVPPNLINRIVRVVFDGLQRSIEWTLSVKSFEQLLELLRSTWVEATGNPNEAQFFPKQWRILFLSSVWQVTRMQLVYYTCLKRDHYHNMTASTATCLVCGSKAVLGLNGYMLVGFAEPQSLNVNSSQFCCLHVFRTCNTNCAMVQDTLNVQDAPVYVETKWRVAVQVQTS